MAAFDGLREGARTALEIAARARDRGFVANARRTLLPLPLLDRRSPAPGRVFPSMRPRPAHALERKKVGLAAGAGGGRAVAMIGAARAFEEARVEPALVS